MSAAARDRRRAKGKRGVWRSRPLLIAACLMGMVLAVGLCIYRWPRTASPRTAAPQLLREPPAIELAGIDPAVAKAISASRAAVCKSPRSAAAWGELGMLFHVHSFPTEAGVCFSQAEQLDAVQARWPYFQGILLSESDPDAAIRELQRAVALCGAVPDAPLLRLGEMLLGQGRLEESKKQFQRVLEGDPANARAHLGLGRLAFLKGDCQEGQGHLVRSAADHRTQKASRVLLAQIRERLGEKGTAQDARTTAALPDDPDWPDRFLDEAFALRTGARLSLIRASALLEQGHYLEAIALSRQLVRDDPEADAAWLILGKALVRQKDIPAAQEVLHRVLRLAPDSVEAHFQLGFASYLRKDYRAAATWYRKATELKPDFVFGYHDLGHCLLLLGDRAGAIEAFRAALRCQPDLADIHRTLGELLAKDGQRAEAFAHARLALQFNPADTTAKKLVRHLLAQIAIPIGP